MNWVALMPLRGGSKSIPDKNIRTLAGRPLFAWSLGAALDSGCFEAVYVATDSERIRDSVEAAFPDGVLFAERSPASATDEASTEQVMLEFQAQVVFDVVGLVQATSPLTRVQDFREAKTRFEGENLDSLLSAVPTGRFLWSADGEALNYDPARRPRRQDFSGSFIENGAFYLTRAAILRDTHCRLGGRIGVHPMHPDALHEIDEPEDWGIVERLLWRRSVTDERLRRIRVLVVDVDGTLTDGGMYYGADGEALKKFDTRDGKGLERLRESGVHVCVITAEDSPAAAARMVKLGLDDYHAGVADKPALLSGLLATWRCGLDEVAWIGDDLGDLECMKQVGFACAPADARAAVREAADYVCAQAGGRGAVREVCDLVVEARA